MSPNVFMSIAVKRQMLGVSLNVYKCMNETKNEQMNDWGNKLVK